MQSASIVESSTPETAVYQRYAAAAQQREEALCCPVQYNGNYLAAIPEEILERDYGCGDPSPYVQPGDTVVDLGSGTGKLCYIMSQVVGATGRVIGVDCNREMLDLARRHRAAVAERTGFDNVDFRYGMIQDLSLNLEELAHELAQHPVRTPDDWLTLRSLEDRLRQQKPLISDASVDCVVSNCVLNLVRQSDRRQLFAEIFRVLKNGGRAAISDIVADEAVPEHLQADPTLWSGCISGAFREDQFLQAFADAGFHGMTIVKRQSEPWRVVQGIEFRSVTVLAYKGEQGPSLERNQAVIYRGPFRQVHDDDGNTYFRGERMAVGDKQFRRLQQAPYRELFDFVTPHVEIPLETAVETESSQAARRDPRVTKGPKTVEFDVVSEPCCSPDGQCC